MISFDVASLFTPVPTGVACDVAKKRLEEVERKGDSPIFANTGMDVDDILMLLRLCLDSRHHLFSGKRMRLVCQVSVY